MSDPSLNAPLPPTQFVTTSILQSNQAINNPSFSMNNNAVTQQQQGESSSKLETNRDSTTNLNDALTTRDQHENLANLQQQQTSNNKLANASSLLFAGDSKQQITKKSTNSINNKKKSQNLAFKPKTQTLTIPVSFLLQQLSSFFRQNVFESCLSPYLYSLTNWIG
jgi:hypothetical protein